MTLPNLHHWLADLERFGIDERPPGLRLDDRAARADRGDGPAVLTRRIVAGPMRVAGVFAGRGSSLSRDTLAVTGRASIPVMEARIVQLPTPADPRRADRIVIERLVVRDPALASILAERAPEDRPALVERALRIGSARAPGCGGDRQRRRRSDGVREAHAPDRAGQHPRGRGAGPDAPPELRRWRRPPAADARAVPRRPRRAAVVRERAVRRDEARQRDRPDADAPRHVLRRRRVAARGPARPHPPALPDAPVPGRDHVPVRPPERAPGRDRGRGRGARRRAGPVGREGRGLRGPPRGDARRLRPRRRRPARPDRVGGGWHAPLQEGRLRAHDRPRPDRRHGRPDRRRGQGPPDVGSRRSARSCARRRRTGRPRSRSRSSGRTTRRPASPRSTSAPATSTA